ncbi:hypothetical protein HPB50_000020 [Hyalomma asiaticum]|uniref:Uncharacterized protein n=1 Tax=Hyalomma asiaticum TaxID=266040 RepID=A0ACB7RLG4_HYAAI|nr:hypothetical protein HPB50_000020 [Hyalomma asiaticum]
MPAGETNSSGVRPNDEAMEHPEEAEAEREGGGNGEETVELGLPEFLSRHVKIGKFVPVPMQRSGDIRMEESETLLEAPSLVTPLLKKQPNQFFTEDGAAYETKTEKKTVPVTDKKGNIGNQFFQSAAGELLIGIGLSRALEVVNRDSLRLKERDMKKASVQTQGMLDEHRRLTEAHQQAKAANAPFIFTAKHCRVCNFKTESSLVLEGHLLTPHITSRRELRCSFCTFVTRDAKAMVFHMETVHNKLPTMDPPPQFYECPFCPFETNIKAKATSHVNRCHKYFNSRMNQLPPSDFQPPGVTAKPITVEDIKAYEQYSRTLSADAAAKSAPNRPYAALSRNGPRAGPKGAAPSLYQKLVSAASQDQNRRRGRPSMALIQSTTAPNRVIQVVANGSEAIPLLNGSSQLTVTFAHAIANNGILGPGPAPLHPVQRASPGQPPRQLPVGPESVATAATTFVICEICDGYIKDLEQLRTHMQWLHKVRIHTKMLTCRPPLNCQKCQWRFFTDQGLERHLLGAHGLVTSNMQDLASSDQDGGRCTVCGRHFASKLVAHMTKMHRVVLKPAHLSYKCTVCAETFKLYKLFEHHVYTAHSGAMKRTSDAPADNRPAKRPFPAKQASACATAETKPKSKGTTSVQEKPAPQPSLSESSEAEGVDPTDAVAATEGQAKPQMRTRCATCDENVDDFAEHLKEKHMQDCHVRVCHIEKCDQCLSSVRGMIVLHTPDSDDEDSSEDDEEEEDGDDEEGAAVQEPTIWMGPAPRKMVQGQTLKNPTVDDQRPEWE